MNDSPETDEIFEAYWVTHSTTNLKQIRAMLEQLESQGALEMTQIHIVAVDGTQTILLPDGRLMEPTLLPAEGCLVAAE